MTDLPKESFLNISVTSRISRLSYGHEFQCDYIEGTHDECDRVYDEAEGKYKAKNQMHWYLKKVSEFRIVISNYRHAYQTIFDFPPVRLLN